MSAWFSILAAGGLQQQEQRLDIFRAIAEGAGGDADPGSLWSPTLRLALALLALALIVCWLIVLVVRSRSKDSWSHAPPQSTMPPASHTRTGVSDLDGPVPRDTQWIASAGFVGRRRRGSDERPSGIGQPSSPADELRRLQTQMAAAQTRIASCVNRIGWLEEQVASLRLEVRQLKRTGGELPPPAPALPSARPLRPGSARPADKSP